MTLFDELKERKVFRVAAAYVVVAWLVLQFTDLVFENLNAPAWVMQAVMALLAVGFPVALVLAWAFDVSPDDENASPGSKRAFVGLVTVVSIAVLSFLAWDNFFESGASRSDEAASATDVIDSIAVLPFDNFSGESADEYFGDGLADTLLHKLAQLRTLRVIARNSSFQFKGDNKDVREVGEILGVAAILEGSVQRQGDQIRIIAQLIRTSDGSHIWSQTYDDQFRNIFELQDRIAQAIMEQLQISISDIERQRVYRDGTDSAEAYDLLVRADGKWNNSIETSVFDPATDEVLALINRALELDPSYAQAWLLHGARHETAAFISTDSSRFQEFVDIARKSANKALEIDPDFADAYVELGFTYWRTRNLNKAIEYFAKGLELDPNSSGALTGLGLATMGADPEGAYRNFQRVLEIDPRSSITYRQMFFALGLMGRTDEALATLLTGVERHPDETIFYSDLAEIYIVKSGRPDEGARWASKLLQRQPNNLFGLSSMIDVWRSVADYERADDWQQVAMTTFPASTDVLQRAAVIQSLTGAPGDAIRILQATDTSNNFMLDRARAISSACLMLGDRSCIAEQADILNEALRRLAESGASAGFAEVYKIYAEILAAIAEDQIEGEQRTRLVDLSERMQSWPVFFSGGREQRHTGYRLAMLFALLGDEQGAVDELHRTLLSKGGGFLPFDFLGLPPDANPILLRLQGMPGYDEWFAEFTGRRELARGKLVEMEAQGDLLSSGDVSEL